MKHLTKLSLIILILFCSLTNAQSDPELLKYFKKIKTIELDEKASIKLIRSLDVDKPGRMLLIDISGKVYLFTPDGSLIKELKSDECSPGINWKPFDAIFKQDGEIFIQNIFPGSMRFLNNGKCLKKIDDKKFIPGLLLSSFTDGSIIVYNNQITPGVTPFSIYDKEGNPINKFGKQQEEFKSFIRQLGIMALGGMAVDNKDIIYRVNFNSAEIAKYDKAGKPLGTIFRKPDRYIQLREDIPQLKVPRINFNDKKDVENNKKAISEFKKETQKFAECTYSEKLFLLNNDLLLLMYTIGDDHGVQIFNTKGNYLLNKDLKLARNEKLILAKNGLLFFVEEADLKNDSNKFNPALVIYKYIGKKN